MIATCSGGKTEERTQVESGKGVLAAVFRLSEEIGLIIRSLYVWGRRKLVARPLQSEYHKHICCENYGHFALAVGGECPDPLVSPKSKRVDLHVNKESA